jgi:sarcosine oxidase subunit gamma
VAEVLPSWTQSGHFGAAGSGIAFAEATIAAAWNVQGNRARGMFAEEARRLFELDLPAVPNAIAKTDALTALWLAPTSWLLVAGGASPLHDFGAKRDALNAMGGALFDLSASRVAWTVSGIHAATVLAKGCPLDFHPRAFAPGTCAQSLFGHVNALFVNDGDAFTLFVARSFAADVWHALTESAAQYGYDVRPPAPYR